MAQHNGRGRQRMDGIYDEKICRQQSVAMEKFKHTWFPTDDTTNVDRIPFGTGLQRVPRLGAPSGRRQK